MKRLMLVGAANELKIVNHLLKIPFGAYDHRMGLQVFGAPEAAACVAAFNEAAAKSGFKGLPVYIGHPDVKAFQDKYRDHAAYGWITAMAANEEEGRLELTVEWTPPGESLVANEQFAYFSPLWLSVKKAGNLHPFCIKSVGLTQEPNIQFLAVACEELAADEATPNEGANMDLTKLRAWISRHWTNETALEEAPNELVIEETLSLLEAHEAEVASANEAVPETAQATITQLQSEIETANESLGALRKEHSGLLLDQALADGRITPATRAKWEDRFGAEGADFAALANELGSIDVTMKTKSVTKGAKPGDNGGATESDVVAAANELSVQAGIGFTDAWLRVKKDDRFAHLFVSKQS